MRWNAMRRSGRLFIYLSIMILISINLPSHAYAAVADDPITVNSETATLNFPKAMDFQLDTQDSASPIEIATLTIKFNYMRVSEVHPITQTPANHLSFQWHENLDAQHFMPVGTIINYTWDISDSAGHSYKTPPKSLQITDTRFQWQHLSQGLYQVNWYDRPTSFGQLLLNQTGDSLKRIYANLGVQLHQSINLWVYENSDDFHSSLPPDSAEWVGGVAFFEINQASVTVQGADDTTLNRDLPHELTHLVLHQTAQVTIPTWFDEGLAVYNQAYHEGDMQNQFKTQLTKHSLIPLYQIDRSFPRDAQKAYQAYSQSWQLLDYMYKTFGVKKMNALIQSTGNSDEPFDTDQKQALGVDSDHLENQWHLHLNQPATLSGADQTQQQATQTTTDNKPAAATSDSSDAYLTVAGSLLISIPLVSGVLLLIFLFYSRRKARAQAAIIPQPAYNYMPPAGNYHPGSSPAGHYANPATYRPAGHYDEVAGQPPTMANNVPPAYTAYPPYPWGDPTSAGARPPEIKE
ncbi:peptidase MA family metallohydrolase [Dictyobacter aurantiacus]|uniref:Peptidase MA-like domain-containing protein n=1 Tax=Dictyobacter aurantiacus TaxID=1936993 RepID=A0A401ZB90_9CHLR|nr:peptidase MA family metallohydrolase [Dictyobacter aurantiacus]GCE04096.1 hypothetical protein KDAU_14250 [Dictyobacter aurantiacus]